VSYYCQLRLGEKYLSAVLRGTAFGVNFIFGFPPLVMPDAGTRLVELTSASLPCPGASLSPVAALFRALKALGGTVGCCGGSDILMDCFAVKAKFPKFVMIGTTKGTQKIPNSRGKP
jgi:hypothetical protein